MMRFNHRFIHNVLFGLLLGTALLFAYWPELSAPTHVNKDNYVVSYVRSLTSVQDYIRSYQEHRNIDIQPVRDLSLKIDCALEPYLGKNVFLVHNLLLWFVACLLLALIMSRWGVRSSVIWPCLLVFAVDPLFSGSVAWITARKHLLSLVFILLATWFSSFARNGEKRSIRMTLMIVGAYGLAVFSQPISLLWPLWLALTDRPKTRSWFLIFILTGVMVVAAWANYSYFTGTYALQGSEKFSSYYVWQDSLLAFGRYIFQLIFPLFLSGTYDEGALWNLIGLMVFPILVYISIKMSHWKMALRWWTFALLPLSVVLVRMTTIFVSDTYLLVPASGLLILVSIIVNAWPNTCNKYVWSAAILLAIGGIGLTRNEVNYWKTDLGLLKHYYDVEKSCYNSLMLARVSYTEGVSSLFHEATETSIQKRCVGFGAAGAIRLEQMRMYVWYIVDHREWSISQKLENLASISEKSTYAQVAMVVLQAEGEGDKEALLTYQRFHLSQKNWEKFWTFRDPLALRSTSLCRRHRLGFCSDEH